MAKGDKTDVRNAKTAASFRKTAQVVKNRNVTSASGKVLNKTKSPTTPKGGRKLTDKFEKEQSKMDREWNKMKSLKPSMPVKTGVKNKVKAQGFKSMGAPTSGYNKTKPKGK